MAVAVQILQDVAISPNLARHEPQVTCAYPSSCGLDGGEVLCVYRRGKDKHSRDACLVGQRSADGGKSWSDRIVIHDGMQGPNPESVHAGVVCQISDGSVLAMFKTVEAKEHGEFIFSDKGRQLRQQLYAARSRDGGQTWAPAEPKQLEAAPRDHYVGTRPLVLPGGEVFLPVEAMVDGSVIVLATSSPDGGATWRPLWMCAVDESGAVSYGDPRLAMLPDGRILMLVWTWLNKTEETLEVHRLVSRDQGRTWSPPAATGVASQIMTPLAVGDGRLIAVSNVRREPQGIRFWVSDDCGESWSIDHPIQMWDVREERMKGLPLNGGEWSDPQAEAAVWESLPGFTFGTPELVAVGENQFVLTYYATVRGILHVRGCRFRLIG